MSLHISTYTPLAMEFTTQQSTGVSILVVVSVLSFLAVLGLLFAIALSAFNTRHSTDRFMFVRTHGAAYFISLMICWLIQCIASLLNIRWLGDHGIHSGSVCNAQGALKHISDVGVAIWTLAMAGHTFCLLFLELNSKKHVMGIVLVLGWVIIGIIVGSGSASVNDKVQGPFYDVNGVWCWISPRHKVQLITLGYMIIFLSAFLSGILYLITFLRLRGNLRRDGWKLSFHRVRDSTDKYFSNDRTKLVAKQMLLYPLAYAILVLPVAITRFIAWSGKSVPFELIIFSTSIYLLSGFVNVILFTTTRRILPLSSMRIGNAYLVPSSRLSDSEDDAEKGATKTVTFSAHITMRSPPGRKESRRPPQLVLPDIRDSFASMYSEREGVYIPPPALSSHWSADTPPLQKSSRLSVYLQSFATAAAKM